MKSKGHSLRQRRPSPPRHPGPPNLHPCRRPRTRWSIPRPSAWTRRLLRLLPGSTEDGDAALFGLLWPLGESVKLDSTIDRRTLRAQIARLGELGYALDFKTQEWSRQAELQPA
jgi:hypothetical protein